MPTRRRKLLLADNSLTIQKIVSLTLSDEGFEVLTASGGEEALRLLATHRPDIVLADVSMPGPDGYELCERIKTDAGLRHVPVILLAGAFEPFNQAEARRVGADEVLTKPFQSIKGLVSRVGSLLGGGDDAHDARAAETEANATRAVVPDAHAREVNSEQDATTGDIGERQAPWSEPTITPREEDDDVTLDDAAAPESISFADLVEDDPLIEARPDSASPFGQEAHDEIPEIVAPRPEDEAAAWRAARENFAALKSEPVAATPQIGIAPASDVGLSSATGADQASQKRRADDFLLDLDDIAPAPLASAAAPSSAREDSILDIFDDEPPPQQQDSPGMSVVAGFDEPAPAADAEGSLADAAHGDANANAEVAGVTAPSSFGYDDEETPTLVNQPLAFAPSAAAATASGGATGQQQQQITLEQLSPEAIDAIARRAVELLSERAVREIAWDVVPQLAELLIKQRLDEQK